MNLLKSQTPSAFVFFSALAIITRRDDLLFSKKETTFMVPGVFLALLFSCFLMAPAVYAHDEAAGISAVAEEFFPDAARNAIERYQGEIIVHIPNWIGASEVHGRGFLFHKDGWVISAAHIFTNVPRDVLFEGTRVTFRGEKAVLESLDPLSDIAILKINSALPDFEDVSIAQKLPEGTPVYIAMQGALQHGKIILDFHKGLFMYGRIAGYADVVVFVSPLHAFPVAEFLYITHPVTYGFSGGFYVNAKGEFVGMAIFIEGGFTSVVSAATIQRHFTQFLASKASQGKP